MNHFGSDFHSSFTLELHPVSGRECRSSSTEDIFSKIFIWCGSVGRLSGTEGKQPQQQRRLIEFVYGQKIKSCRANDL